MTFAISNETLGSIYTIEDIESHINEYLDPEIERHSIAIIKQLLKQNNDLRKEISSYMEATHLLESRIGKLMLGDV